MKTGLSTIDGDDDQFTRRSWAKSVVITISLFIWYFAAQRVNFSFDPLVLAVFIFGSLNAAVGYISREKGDISPQTAASVFFIVLTVGLLLLFKNDPLWTMRVRTFFGFLGAFVALLFLLITNENAALMTAENAARDNPEIDVKEAMEAYPTAEAKKVNRRSWRWMCQCVVLIVTNEIAIAQGTDLAWLIWYAAYDLFIRRLVVFFTERRHTSKALR